MIELTIGRYIIIHSIMLKLWTVLSGSAQRKVRLGELLFLISYYITFHVTKMINTGMDTFESISDGPYNIKVGTEFNAIRDRLSFSIFLNQINRP